MTLWRDEPTSRPSFKAIRYSFVVEFTADEMDELLPMVRAAGYTSGDGLVGYIKFAALGPNYSPSGT